MAITFTDITAATVASTSNVTTYASASFTPIANRLYLLGVVHSDTAPEATVPTVATTTGLAFVQVGSSIAFDTVASNVHRLTLFRAMKSSGLSNGTYTITLGDAGTGATGLLLESNDQINTGGTDGSSAVTNISTNNGDASANPTVTLGAFSNNNNAIVAFYGSDIVTAPTAPDGWTAASHPDYNTPATGGFGMWIGGVKSPATCTLSTSDWAAIAVEVVSASTTNYETLTNKYPDRVVLGKAEVVVYGDFPGRKP
jgi:hypothetical protein